VASIVAFVSWWLYMPWLNNVVALHALVVRWTRLLQDKEQKRQRRKQAKSGSKMMVRS
jgi:hypothetical protein